MKTKFGHKIISFFVLFSLLLSPVFTFAIDIYDPTVDPDTQVDLSAPPKDDVRVGNSNYRGTENLSNLKKDQNGAGSLASCSQAVPAAQRAILGIQNARANPVSQSVLESVFQNLPTLITAGKQLGSYYSSSIKAKDDIAGLEKQKAEADKAFASAETNTDKQEAKKKQAEIASKLEDSKKALTDIQDKRTQDNKKTWKNYANTALDLGTLGFASGAIAKKEQKGVSGDRLTELKEQETFRTECLDSIKIAIASNLLDRGTEEMISKIQTGNWGDPMYVQNGNDYLNNLKDQTILDVFGTDLSNRKAGRDLSNPYALQTIKSIIGTNQEQTFQERTKYTLGAKLLSIQNKYGQGTGAANAVPDAKASAKAVKEFSQDFSKGGWEAWLSLTQNPANNPIGYAILAQEELAKKEAQQKEAIEAESNPQLLSTKVCDSYEDKNGKIVNKKNFSINPNSDEKCKHYTITSPGSILTERMKWYVTSDVRRLELANKFNSSISEVMSAGINRLTKYGLDQLGQTVTLKWTTTTASPLAQYNTNMAAFTAKANGNVVKYKNALYDLRIDLNSTYFKEDINLERDLNDVQVGCVIKKGFVTTQQEYVDELKYMADESTSPLPKIMPYLSLLDMCIPGPTPAWQDYADPHFAEYIDAVSAQDPQKLSAPNLAFTKINNLLNKRDKTAGTMNTIGDVAVSVGSVVPPPYGSIVMAAGALTKISASIVKNKKIGGKNGVKPDIYRQAMLAFQEFVPMAIEEEANRNKQRDIQKSIETYESYVGYIGDRYSESRNLPVTERANPVIGDLVQKNKNIENTRAAYSAEYEKSIQTLAELKSIQAEVNSIYAEARANQQAEFDKTNTVPGAKWDDIPEVCRQVCAVVKKPETKQNFPSIESMLKGFKLLDNGNWTSGYNLKDILRGAESSLLTANDPGALDYDKLKLVAAGPITSGSSGGTRSPTAGSGTQDTYSYMDQISSFYGGGLYSTNPTSNPSSSSQIFDKNTLPALTPVKAVSINSFSVDNDVINLGDSAVLEWDVTGADSIEIKNKDTSSVIKNTTDSSGTYTVRPLRTTTYLISIKSGTIIKTNELTVTVIK